jgi:hypothetical protein
MRVKFVIVPKANQLIETTIVPNLVEFAFEMNPIFPYILTVKMSIIFTLRSYFYLRKGVHLGFILK